MSDFRRPVAKRGAFESALALLRQPGLSRNMQRAEIPSDVLLLIKISAGDQALCDALSDKHNVSSADVQAAAKLFIQGIMTTAKVDDRRMLCLPDGAGLEDAKEHKKWLLKWLHPDRNHDSWQSKLFLKVNEAFNRLQAAPFDAAAVAHMAAPVSRHRHASRRRSHSYKNPAYQKVGFAGLFQQATKPILVVAVLALLVCVGVYMVTVQRSNRISFIPNFAFLSSFN